MRLGAGTAREKHQQSFLIAGGAEGEARLPPGSESGKMADSSGRGGRVELTTKLFRMRLRVKMSILSTLIYRYNATPIKIPAGFLIFGRHGQAGSRMCEHAKCLLFVLLFQNMCGDGGELEGFPLPDSQTSYIKLVTKTASFWSENHQTVQGRD